MKSPKVCVIIVTYNGFEWIEKCINSLSNSESPVDIMVIDNGSTDGTLEFLRKSKKLTYLFESKENLGFGKANNVGLRYGYQNGYDHFLLLNQDAWVEPNTVGALMKALEQNSDFGLVSPLHFNGQGTELDQLFQTYLDRVESYNGDKKANQIKPIYEAPFVNAACWLLTRKSLEKVGIFHPLFDHYGEDDNYIDRLHSVNLKVGIVPTVKIFHDRDSIGVNPMKDDPRKLYSRTLLQEMLKPQERLSRDKAQEIAKKLEEKGAKRLPIMNRRSFRLFCEKEFSRIFNAVKDFQQNRQSELDIS
ncbi:glycosyltransferase family 2 protein [Ekhidna sp.]|uniref:glycosyltransferase family 2 protein n=1 Tax=Ekhidna sp. TaxID=2608089 RepID=UPI003CCB9819